MREIEEGNDFVLRNNSSHALSVEYPFQLNSGIISYFYKLVKSFTCIS